MTRADIDEVMAIEQDAFPKPWTRELMERELKNPVSFPFIKRVKVNGEEMLAGYMVIWIVYGDAHILDIAVAPSLLRRGIASGLISFALRFMTERGVAVVSLEVRRSNVAAIKLYEDYGFVEAYVRKMYYGDEDAVVMSLILIEEDDIESF
jgi:ribosomal-protein-alanine N-acetyltransferase